MKTRKNSANRLTTKWRALIGRKEWAIKNDEREVNTAKTLLDSARTRLEKAMDGMDAVSSLSDEALKAIIAKTEPRLRPTLGHILDCRNMLQFAEGRLSRAEGALKRTEAEFARKERPLRQAFANGGAFGKQPLVV